MTGTEQNQIRRQQDQAVVDALMSDDAARAIEILYRTVIHGIPVPDPDVVATLAVQPKHPARASRRHAWIRSAVPLAIGLAAVVGSLGWSYSDYNDRQQEWQRIAEEQTIVAASQQRTAEEWARIAEQQTTLAKQQEELANERALLLKQSEDARAQMIARETRLQEKRRKWVDLTRQAIAIEDPVELAVRVAQGADELAIDGPPSEQDMQAVVGFVEDLIRICKKKVESQDVTPNPAR